VKPDIIETGAMPEGARDSVDLTGKHDADLANDLGKIGA
jgi:hypothetical protein